MNHYYFRTRVFPQLGGDLVGMGPIDIWADTEDDARREAIKFERETFGMPRARVELELEHVDSPFADPVPEPRIAAAERSNR